MAGTSISRCRGLLAVVDVEMARVVVGVVTTHMRRNKMSVRDVN